MTKWKGYAVEHHVRDAIVEKLSKNPLPVMSQDDVARSISGQRDICFLTVTEVIERLLHEGTIELNGKYLSLPTEKE